MTAVDTDNNDSVDSKYPARIARFIGIKEDTIYEWMKLGIKCKTHTNKNKGKTYLIYLHGRTL